MIESDRPVVGFIYCLNCFYNLHGLIEHRCPECGRRFDPSVPSTFSASPNPDHLPKIVQRVALAINETVHGLTTSDPALDHAVILRRRVSSLERDNARLRLHVDTLVQILLSNGALNPEDVEILTTAVPTSEAGALEQIVDDDSIDNAEEAESSDELDELSTALRTISGNPPSES